MAMEAVALGWQGIVVAIVLFFSLIIMGFDLVGPDLVFGGMTAIFITIGILPIKDGAAGFSNTGVLTVMALYLVAEGVSQTGGLDLAMNFMLGQKTRSVFWAQVRMMIPVMAASAFLNNTPICALMMPILISWGRRSGISPKKLLIPMSFATVLGGTMTLIGTSTNLVVSGLQQEKYGATNPELVFGFFDITPYGIPYGVWGMAYILIFSRWLLPGDEQAGNALTSGLLVPATSRVAGKTAAQAGLTGGKLVVTALSRGSSLAVPYTQDTVIAGGDIIFVTGNVEAVDEAADQYGLVLLTSDHDHDVGPGGMLSASRVEEGFDSSATSNTASTLVQVRIKKGSPLVGQGVRAVGFRGRFSAAIIAVKRASEVQPGRIGDIVLQRGDVLVLSTATDFNPKSKDFTDSFEKLVYLDEALARQFTTTMVVGRRSKEAGKTISDVGLRGINGLFLFEVVREDGTVLKAVDGSTVIEHGDLLKFAGDLDGVSYLLKYTTLEHAQQRHVAKLPSEQIYHRMVQVVVSAHGGLVGQRLRDVHFRQTYGAAVLGLHRAGRPVPGDLADVPLQTGDVLVVQAGPEFLHNFKHNRAFSLISEVPNSSPMKRNRMWIALLLTLGMVATQIGGGATKEFIHLWPCAMLVAGLMLIFKCMSAEQARSSIDWEVYVCIAFAFAVSTAMEKTKLAQAIAQLFVGLSRAIGGQTAALACIYLVTSLLSELLTNNAAAAIMYPIASSAADTLGIHPNVMSVAVMLGGSAGWALPYSYQCNLMVYAAGKYRTKDFVRLGAPFHVWLFAGVILILGFGERWIIPLVASLIFTALVILLPALYEYVLSDAQRAAIGRMLPGRRKKAHGSSDTLLPLAPSSGKSNGSFNGAALAASKDVDVAPQADVAARR